MKLMLLNEVAALLGCKPYRIQYAIVTGLIAEPKLRIGNKRVFQMEDVRRLAQHFEVELDLDDTEAKVGVFT